MSRMLSPAALVAALVLLLNSMAQGAITYLPYADTCVQARNRFVSLQHQDVLDALLDPVWFYQANADTANLVWPTSTDSTLCAASNGPVYLEDDFSVNCEPAIALYNSTHNVPADYPGGVFGHWRDNVNTSLAVWHGELCWVPRNCTCLAARQGYSSAYGIPATTDPIYHYATYRYQYPGVFSLDCTLCEDTPIYIDDARCNCEDAAVTFNTTYGAPIYNHWTAWQRFQWFSMAFGYGWVFSDCISYTKESDNPATTITTTSVATTGGSASTTGSTTGNPAGYGYIIPSNCTCLAAKQHYWGAHGDVTMTNIDAIYHYQKYGYMYPSYGNWEKDYCTSATHNYCLEMPEGNDNPKCSQCPEAIAKYVAAYPDAATYAGGAYQHYLDNNLDSPVIWHCENCILNHSCTCWQVMQQYWIMYPETAAVDPLYHYVAYGRGDSRDFPSCDLCTANSTVYLDTPDSLCNCSAAQHKYLTDYANEIQAYSPYATSYAANPLQHYLDYHMFMGFVWHCELCALPDNPTPPPTAPPVRELKHLNFTCTCLAARVFYLMKYSTVASTHLDPVAHYENDGWANGNFEWDCSYCSENPVYVNDSVSQCTAAVHDYATRYQVSETDAWNDYWNNYLTTYHSWNAQLCLGALQNLTPKYNIMTPFCSCMAARFDYLQRNPAVNSTNLDPVAHYDQYFNVDLSLQWHCELCLDSPVYIDDSWSQTCNNAVASYVKAHPAALNCYNPFSAYWNYFLKLAYPWHSESCIPTTASTSTTSVSVTTTTGSTTGPALNCFDTASNQCMAARNYYLATNPDVLIANNDPIYHFKNNRNNGRTWNCDVCDVHPTYLQDVCNCSAAASAFISNSGQTVPAGEDPFAYFLSFNYQIPYRWRCELCNISNEEIVFAPADDCIASRAAYLYTYPDTSLFDSVYHYKTLGFYMGYTWRGDLCSTAPHQITESVTDCPQARASFSQFPIPATCNNTLRACWQPYYANFGTPWRFDLCAVNVTNPSYTLTCNCTAARILYTSQYSVSGDPWAHYTSTGQSLGNTWDCGICNDTCSGMITTSHFVYPSQPLPLGKVIVPQGCYVPLSTPRTIQGSYIYVNGTLRCQTSGSIGISAVKMYIYGNLECGTEASPFNGALSITIDYTSSGSITPTEQGSDKSLAVFAGGRLSLHGAKQVSWTTLAATAAKGSQTLSIADAVDWQIGDSIVITSTDPIYSANVIASNEIRTISNISSNVITLSSPISYDHIAETYTFSPGLQPLTLRKTAEIGLLSGRNIKITSSEPTGNNGVEVLVLAGGQAQVSGIELSFAGKVNVSHANAFHFYRLGDAIGQYFKSSTINAPFAIGVALTSTNNAEISGNFVFSATGSAISLVNGVETGNTISSNLAVGTIADGVTTVSKSYAVTPASFLLTNTFNHVMGNIAAGSNGTGFWIKPEATSGDSTSTVVPSSAPWGTFQNNTAHGVWQGLSTCSAAGGGYDGSSVTGGVVDSFVVYGAEVGLWPCGATQSYSNMIVAEVVLGSQLTDTHDFTNTAWIAYLKSTATPAPPASNAIALADSGFSMASVFFSNFDSDPDFSIFTTVTSRSTFNPNTAVAGVVLDNSPVLYADPTNITFRKGYNSEWSHFVTDQDGTLTASTGAATLVTSHPLMRSSACHAVPEPAKFGYICPSQRFTELKLQFDAPGLNVAAIGRTQSATRKRADSDTATGIEFPPPGDTTYQWSAVVNSQDVYTFVLPISTRKLTGISLPSYAQQGDSVALKVQNVYFVSGQDGTQGTSCDAVINGNTQQSYFDSKNSVLCVRLVASQSAGAGNGFTSPLVALSAVAGNSTVGQPAPINTDGPADLRTVDTCISAMQKYWATHPQVNASNFDAVFHYQTQGYLANYTWPAEQCADATEPHYVTEAYCGTCAPALALYNATYPDVAMTYDNLYQHYILYRFVLGNAYHCELCQPPVPEDQIKIMGYNSGLAAGLGALISVAVLLSFFVLVCLLMNFHSFGKHGPFYASVIIIGTLFAYAAALVLLPRQTDALCVAFPWLLGVGFILTYGSLFIKTWALFNAWHAATQFKRVNVTPRMIIQVIGLCLLVEIIFLIIWTVVDPPKLRLHKLVDSSYQYQCESKHPTFWIIFCTVKGLWLIFGAVLSVLTRNVTIEYSESKNIAYAVYNDLLLSIIAVPLALALRGVPNGTLIIEVGVIVLAFAFTLFILFYGTLHEIFFPKEVVMANTLPVRNTNSGTTSAGTHSHSSNKSGGSSHGSSHSSHSS
eukprot:Phypoly_transcript_00095.p1 GENE.Phypoly_transcript_00095~~Phypoly_transcript_00095.p1  ORF type:complete len:2248 (+),score=271.90 Phypoly_transcript_00095:220-6963(+)